jgi:hypothetical protein
MGSFGRDVGGRFGLVRGCESTCSVPKDIVEVRVRDLAYIDGVGANDGIFVESAEDIKSKVRLEH